MITVTSEYLINVIERHIRESVAGKVISGSTASVRGAELPSELIADFLLSIPYFDEGLKNFILGMSREQVMIVSQAWEIEFILRTKTWANDEAWLAKPSAANKKIMVNDTAASFNFLKLPY